MSFQFIFLGQAREVVVKHFECGLRRFAVRPQAQQHAGDDRAIDLNPQAIGFVAEQVPTTEQVLEEAEEQLDGKAVLIQQRWSVHCWQCSIVG